MTCAFAASAWPLGVARYPPFPCGSSSGSGPVQLLARRPAPGIPLRGSFSPARQIPLHGSFFPARQTSLRAGAGAGSSSESSLESELDAIDDMVYNRPPSVGRDKVKVFGAWLDADIAGRRAGKGNRAEHLKERAANGEELTDAERAEVFYEEAIQFLDRGDYDVTEKLLERAVSYVGEDSRRGGEYKLWLVTALQGIGRDKKAVEVLKGLKTHRDKDVRHVAGELLYIAEAPRLRLRQGVDFVNFPDTDVLRDGFDKEDYKMLGKPRAAFQKGYKEEKKPAYEVTAYSEPPKIDFAQIAALTGAVLVFSAAFLLR